MQLKSYLEGVSVTEKKLNEVIELLEEKIKRQERQSTYTSGISSTSVCGGGGVEVNGKHHGAGKTGCVRVYSDGRIEKY
jgi:succinate dehydrogenase/fumarate reductase-like Fe-S protein